MSYISQSSVCTFCFAVSQRSVPGSGVRIEKPLLYAPILSIQSRRRLKSSRSQAGSTMKFGVKPTPISLSRFSARTLLSAVFFLFTAFSPSSVTDSRPRKMARSPQSFHISMRWGNLQMMSVRVCTVKYLRMPAALICRAISSPRFTFIQKMSSVMKMFGALICSSSATTRAGDFSRNVDSWNFQTEQKLHLNGQPRAVSISARGGADERRHRLLAVADGDGVDAVAVEPVGIARGVVAADDDEGARALALDALREADRALALGGEVALQADDVGVEGAAERQALLLALRSEERRVG